VKAEFQRRITSITLTADVDEHGPIYRITGDVDLFSVPKNVMQTNQVHLIGLHYTKKVSIEFEIAAYKIRPAWTESNAA